jgi:hypothetical protein
MLTRVNVVLVLSLAHQPLGKSKGSPMKDLVFVVVTAAFFAVTWIYAKSFDRL